MMRKLTATLAVTLAMAALISAQGRRPASAAREPGVRECMGNLEK